MSVRRVVELVEQRVGIVVDRGVLAGALDWFLDARVRELKIDSVGAYADLLVQAETRELPRLLSAVTVAHSWFFRDAGQLELAVRLLARRRSDRARASIWVPGCAGGEDVYALALLAERAGIDVAILGTDVSPAAIERARVGCYGAWEVRAVPRELGSSVTRRRDGSYEVDASIKRSVEFAEHNLLDAPPAPPAGSGWDLVLCRNVLIYFARARVPAVIEHLGAALADGGFLLLGAGDLVLTAPRGLRPIELEGRLALERSGGSMPPREPNLHGERSPRSAPRRDPSALVRCAPAPEPSPRSSVDTPPARSDELAELISKGNACFERGDCTQALAIYAKASELAPVAGEPHFFAGVVHYSRGAHREAAHRLRSALFLDQTLWPASFYLALCYERLDRADDAAREYRRVLSAEKCNAVPFRSRSAIAEDLTKWRDDLLFTARRRARSKP
jgi:chemotaxis protein methyltransferase CheR